MKKTIILAFLALFTAFFLPFVQPGYKGKEPLHEESSPSLSDMPEEKTPAEQVPVPAADPAPEKIRLLVGDSIQELNMQDYIIGVVAAEMPADFPPEALKAQAVAARSYAMYCAEGKKHGEAQICSDFNCCQAWIDTDKMQENWGDAFEKNYKKISEAVSQTRGQFLSYEGAPVFAAFHSSSAGRTADCGDVWNPRPYLISVSSPESEKNVPDFISSLECAPLDFRDTVLSAFPEADFTSGEDEWIGDVRLDESGRVAFAELGGVKIKGTELRSLFSLRSTAFTLAYSEGKFIFTVRGFGHGVGMSQYGAKLMAENGEDYAAILAHYYPGTCLSS